MKVKMKVKNEEVLLRCGFRDAMNEDYILLVNTESFYVNEFNEDNYVCVSDGELTFITELEVRWGNRDLSSNILKWYTGLIVEMTKAGCFDEKPKTLEELGYKQTDGFCVDHDYNWDNEKTGSTILITKDLQKFCKYGGMIAMGYYECELITLEEHKAIMLKMEELKHGK